MTFISKLKNAGFFILVTVSCSFFLTTSVVAATFDATGDWYLSISNGWTDGGADCPVEVDKTLTARITQSGNNVTVVVLDAEAEGDVIFTGYISGAVYHLSAYWVEDDGNEVTIAGSFTLVSNETGSGKLDIAIFDPTAQTKCNKGMDIGLSKTGIATSGGYFPVSALWTKAVLEVPGSSVTLIWKEVGQDTTPIGDRVISGYFYADPDDFAYGSLYNPEVFVKIYIAASGWCNIAFNHVTVDNVTVYSAHNYSGTPDQTGSATLSNRLVEHQYNGVSLQ